MFHRPLSISDIFSNFIWFCLFFRHWNSIQEDKICLCFQLNAYRSVLLLFQIFLIVFFWVIFDFSFGQCFQSQHNIHIYKYSQLMNMNKIYCLKIQTHFPIYFDFVIIFFFSFFFIDFLPVTHWLKNIPINFPVCVINSKNLNMPVFRSWACRKMIWRRRWLCGWNVELRNDL